MMSCGSSSCVTSSPEHTGAIASDPAAAATAATGRTTSPPNILDMEAELCSDCVDGDDDAVRPSWAEAAPPTPPSSDGGRGGGGGVALEVDADLVRRFEAAFDAFLEQGRQERSGSLAPSRNGDGEAPPLPLLPSPREIEALHDRLLRAASERARVEAELTSQLEEVERSRAKMERRLRLQLSEASRAKDRSEAELRGQIIRMARDRRDIEESLRREMVGMQRQHQGHQPPPPQSHPDPLRTHHLARAASPPPATPAAVIVRATPSPSSGRARASERGGGGGMIDMAVRDTDAALQHLQQRRQRQMSYELRRSLSAGSRVGGGDNNNVNNVGRSPREAAQQHDNLPRRFRSSPPAAGMHNRPGARLELDLATIDWDDETISTMWAADTAIDDAIVELRASLSDYKKKWLNSSVISWH